MLFPDGFVSGTSVSPKKNIMSGLRIIPIFEISYFLFSNPIHQYSLYFDSMFINNCFDCLNELSL